MTAETEIKTTDAPVADEAVAADPMPETITINGVLYRRESDVDEEEINRESEYLCFYRRLAERTGLSLKQAIWFYNIRHTDRVMPD